MKKGMLYGISTGPGDPELITLKAIHCIEKVPVIAVPRTKGKNCMALDIVNRIMDISGKEICYLDFAMKKDVDVLNTTHKIRAEQIEKYLLQGRDVAMLSIGDASLFSTFCYIRDIVEADGYTSLTIPGVPSFCAVAAALGQSLTTMDSPMTVIPCSYGNVAEELVRPGTKILMKSASSLSEVKRILEENGLSEKTSMVANCGLPDERIYRDIRQSADEEGYFVTMLIQN